MCLVKVKRHIIQIRIRERGKARESEDERTRIWEKISKKANKGRQTDWGDIALFSSLEYEIVVKGPVPMAIPTAVSGFPVYLCPDLGRWADGFSRFMPNKRESAPPPSHPPSRPVRRAAEKGILKRQSVRRVAVCLKLDSICNCGFYCTWVPISSNYPKASSEAAARNTRFWSLWGHTVGTLSQDIN